MTCRSIMFAGAMLALMTPHGVAAQSYSAAEVKKSVKLGDLEAVVKELGHTVSSVGDFGDESLVAQDEFGINYLLIGTACDVGAIPGCQGIMMQVRYDLSPEVTYESVAKANLAQAALNSWVDFEDETVGFTRYQVLDDGVTMANIKANVLVLLELSPIALSIAKGEEQSE